jgi:hypothetical protein
VIDVPIRNVAALLHKIGNSRLTKTMRAWEHLARRICWTAERNFYVLARENPSKRQLYALADEPVPRSRWPQPATSPDRL